MIQRPPRFPKNKIAKILYSTQIAVDAPTFVMFVNHKSRVNFAFKKWVENTIRKHFRFIGVPIVVKYRNRGEKDSEKIFTKEIPVDGMSFEEFSSGNAAPISNNPYNNKGKRKREKKSEQTARPAELTNRPPSADKSSSDKASTPASSRKKSSTSATTATKSSRTPAKRTPPKRAGKYSNVKK
jgi:hypothetical protein